MVKDRPKRAIATNEDGYLITMNGGAKRSQGSFAG
jgi:hypothetical protein